MKSWKRGTTNVIATMLIFSLMIASMGLLYTKISPTLYGFEEESQLNNQEFVMLAVANSVLDLVSSSEDTQNRIHIVSREAVYSVNSGHQIIFDVSDNTGSLSDSGSGANITYSSNIGSFTGNVTTTYIETRGTEYLNSVIDEDSFLTSNTTTNTNYVSKVNYQATEVGFSLYFRSRIEISSQLPDLSYDITIIIIKIDFQHNLVDFPISVDEWSLRLRRRASIITSFVYTAGINTQLNIEHTVDGSSKDNLSFPGLSGQNVQITFVEVPIYFSI